MGLGWVLSAGEAHQGDSGKGGEGEQHDWAGESLAEEDRGEQEHEDAFGRPDEGFVANGRPLQSDKGYRKGQAGLEETGKREFAGGSDADAEGFGVKDPGPEGDGAYGEFSGEEELGR